MNENRKNMPDQDDFWDLSDLVPKRKTPPPRPARSVETTAINVPKSPATGRVFGDIPLTERPVQPFAAEPIQQPERFYTPTSSLIREVRIYPWKNQYNYYEQFRTHAERLVGREGEECSPVDFFSYMPQYTQLNRAQLQYYLWWRTNFRRGICLPAAFSYLLLYLYELINLDECHQNPQTGRENMLRLWISYRETHPRLDPLVREWLCDYCLLHCLPPPALDPSAYRTLLGGCRLKEFYVSAGESKHAITAALLLFCNNYDYTKSKFYNAETKQEYNRVLGGAVDEAVAFLQETDGVHLTGEGGISTVSRDTFSGAICSWKQKRRIEVDYTSFSHTHDLRYVITDVLKYAENALRASRGIKSRLTVYAVSVPLRERLDAYLKKALPPRRTASAKKAEAVPDYERRYDLPVQQVSLQNAAAIEAESWQTTKRLVEAFGGDEEAFTPETVRENNGFALPEAAVTAPPEPAAEYAAHVPPIVPAAPALGGATAACGGLDRPTPVGSPAAEVQPPVANSPFAEAIGPLAAFFALAGDATAQRSFARAQGLMVDAIADKINTVAGDMLGDIVLEEQNGAYVIIEDYLDFLNEQGVLSNGN